MTNRQKYADVFWFTFFHEIGHIIDGDIKDKLIDYEFIDNEVEDRANLFASDTLIDASKYNEFIRKGDFSLASIKELCLSENIPDFILIGRLHRDKHLGYHQYSNKKAKYYMD